MSSSCEQTVPPPRLRLWRLLIGFALVALAIVGFFIVKWSPYYAKVFLAAAHHSIGPSIVSGTAAAPATAGWQAAWQYAMAYYSAVWEAVVLALLLGAVIQVFVPRRWVGRLLGRPTMGSAAIAGTLALAGMM